MIRAVDISRADGASVLARHLPNGRVRAVRGAPGHSRGSRLPPARACLFARLRSHKRGVGAVRGAGTAAERRRQAVAPEGCRAHGETGLRTLRHRQSGSPWAAMIAPSSQPAPGFYATTHAAVRLAPFWDREAQLAGGETTDQCQPVRLRPHCGGRGAVLTDIFVVAA